MATSNLVGQLQFEKEYFRDLRYSQRKCLIKRYILEVLRWGSKVSGCDLLDGNGKTALDVGCAYGYAVDVLESFGYDVCGVDISKYSVKQAKTIRAADFVVCDVQEALPFKDRIFDLVTCFEVVEHLPHPIQAIKNMFESCGHIVICTTPNRAVEKPIKKIANDFDETHISLKVPREWKEQVERSLEYSLLKIEPYFDVNLRVAEKLLFFKSFKVPYFGLDIRILIKR